MNSIINTWILVGMVFLAYFLISYVNMRLGVRNIQNALNTNNGLRLLNLRHVLGIVLFGVLFYLVLPEKQWLIHSLEIPKLPILLLFIVLVLSCFIISINFSRKVIVGTDVTSQYSFYDAWLYSIVRLLFLFAYEFFFRGIILFLLIEHIGVALGIAVSVGLYFLIHIFDSRKELIGTIPFGIILCFLAYLTKSVWYVFFIHATLSVAYELNIFYHKTLKNNKS